MEQDGGVDPTDSGTANTGSLVGTWFAFEVAGSKRPAEYDLVVSSASGAGQLEIGAMALLDDGSMIISDDEVIYRASSEWSRSESGLWRVTSDDRLELIAQGEAGDFSFELDGDRLTVRDAEGSLATFERAGPTPDVTAERLTRVSAFGATEGLFDAVPLSGDCGDCVLEDVFVAFDTEGSVDLIRVHELPSFTNLPPGYPYLEGRFAAVCGDVQSWSLTGNRLTLTSGGQVRTWTVQAEMHDAISLRSGGERWLLIPSQWEQFVSNEFFEDAQLTAVCDALGVPPPGFSPFTPFEWSKALLRARALDEDCPAENADLVGFLDGQDAQTFVAARVTIPSYPFTVHSVRYVQAYNEEFDCLDLLGGEARVFKGTSTTPPDNPNIARTFIVSPQSATSDRELRLVLSTPLIVETGEQLFVSVQLIGDGASTTCVAGCSGVADTVTERSFARSDGSWAVFGSPTNPFGFDFEAVGVSP